MTISILAKSAKIDPHGMSEIPIATNEIFFKYWDPIARELNLHHIISFGIGTAHYDGNSILAVIEQLKVMKVHILNNNDGYYPKFIQRIELLLDGLMKLSKVESIEFDIG